MSVNIPVGNEPVRVDLGDGRTVWVKAASRNVRQWALNAAAVNPANVGSLKAYMGLLVRWGVQRVDGITPKDDDGRVVKFTQANTIKGKVACEALSNVLSDEDEAKILAVVAPDEYGETAGASDAAGGDLTGEQRGNSSSPQAGSTA